jgi:hypothetical protein
MSNSTLALAVSNTLGTPGDRTAAAPGSSPGVDVSLFEPYQRTFRFGLAAGDLSTKVEIQGSNDNANWQSIATYNADAANPDEGVKIDDNSIYYRTLRIAGVGNPIPSVTCILAGQDTTAGPVPAPVVVRANAIAFGDPVGNLTSDVALVAAPLNAGRPQIWDNRAGGAGPVFRQGSWQVDGDPSSNTGDGIVSYGPNSLGLGPNAAQGGYARVKFNRFGLAQIIPAVLGGALYYAIRMDSDPIGGIDGLQFKDDEQGALQLVIARSTGTIQFGNPVSPAATPGAARFFGNQAGTLFGSNAGMQYSSLIANRAQVRFNAFGGHTGVAGMTGFKSRAVAIGGLLALNVGDVMLRLTAIGVPTNNASLNLAGLFSMQAGIVGVAFVSTDFEFAQATSTGGTRPTWLMVGESADLQMKVAGARIRVKEGANAMQGVAVTGAGSVVNVPNTLITANTRISLTWQDGGAFPAGAPIPRGRTPGASFDIESTNPADVGVKVFWQLWEPAP